MRHEGLDPEGKVGLAGMLLQIGFKDEAIAEYTMAAEMYVERGDKNRAIRLFNKVLELDPDNATARRGLSKLKPRTQDQIDQMIAQMGFASEQQEENAVQESGAAAVDEQKEAIPGTQVPEEMTEPEDVKDTEPSPVHSTAEETARETAPEVSEDAAEETAAGVTEAAQAGEVEIVEKDTIDISAIALEEFLASITPLLTNTPEELGKRRELAEMFGEQGMWSEAFFEARSAYLHEPTPDKLNHLLTLLAHPGEEDTLTTFLLTERFADRKPELKTAVLQALAETYSRQGRMEDAAKIRTELDSVQSGKKNNSTVKIIGDVPELKKKDKKDSSDDKKSAEDSIQFI